MSIRIFIGTEPKTEIARKVLEYSIVKNTVEPDQIQCIPMMGNDWINRAETYLGTGFSLLRWDIPQRCNYEGFAIYLDADIIALGDIAKLWRCDVDYPNNQCSVWGTYRTHQGLRRFESSVMLIDCAKAQTNQPNLEASTTYIERDMSGSRTNYKKIMWAIKHKNPPQEIPSCFNRLNDPSPESDCVLLHYTIERKQPWYNPEHPFTHLWEQLLIEAIEHEFVTKEEVREALDKFRPPGSNIRPFGLHPYWKKVL